MRNLASDFGQIFICPDTASYAKENCLLKLYFFLKPIEKDQRLLIRSKAAMKMAALFLQH